VLQKRELAEDAKNRIEVLVRIWGNRSLYEEVRQDGKYLGGLYEEVFSSFGLPLIQGLPLNQPFAKWERRTKH